MKKQIFVFVCLIFSAGLGLKKFWQMNVVVPAPDLMSTGVQKSAEEVKLPPLEPEEKQKQFETLAAQMPKAKLKELKRALEVARERYQQSLGEYEVLERQLSTQILMSANPSADRQIERLHEDLNQKLGDLQIQTESVKKATAEFNERLFAIVEKMPTIGKAR